MSNEERARDGITCAKQSPKPSGNVPSICSDFRLTLPATMISGSISVCLPVNCAALVAVITERWIGRIEGGSNETSEAEGEAAD